MPSPFREKAEELLALADVRVDGGRPWDLQVHDERLFQRALSQGSLGLGEAYMDGWWDCGQLDEFFHRVLRARLQERVDRNLRLALLVLQSKLINIQSKGRAKTDAAWHYDLGNDLYQRMLDKRMTYTCGYWKDAKTLDEAQEAKLELACRKLGLKPGMRVLDIGCGWGSFMKYAAEKHGVEVVGVTLSKEQAALGKGLCAGLPVEFRIQDYRDIQGTYDRVVSIGMFEQVGHKNFRTYMEVASRALVDDGIFLLHTIGGSTSETTGNPWLTKHIFPGSMIPSAAQITAAIEGLFVMEDWHNFGPHYDKTLMAWLHNFEKHWKELEPKYGERFRRMWRYYLCSSAGAFRARHNHLWQVVLSKRGIPGGYECPR
jgi:cyclopropane-fatty-acyl-phospholipid synthase